MAKDTNILEEVEETEVEETKASVIRPGDLAKELEVDAKQIRAYLRKQFPRTAEQMNTSWNLTAEQAEAVRDRFSPAEDEDEDEA